VENSSDAVRALERETFDIALMDVQMPEMSGLEVAAVVREREKVSGGHIPIVALTAHAMARDEARCLAAGMDSYLAKPLRPPELFQVLETLVKS
jgi:two-component system sensor histidine kinase/response regulator